MLTLHVEGKNFDELVENACKVLGFRFESESKVVNEPAQPASVEAPVTPPKKRGRPAKAVTTSVAPPVAAVGAAAEVTPPVPVLSESTSSDVELMKTELHKLFDPRPEDKGPQGKFRVLGILKKFDYSKTSDIKPEHYSEIIRLAKAENDAYAAKKAG